MSEPTPDNKPLIEGAVLSADKTRIKPAHRTTEFWLTIALIVLSNGMAFVGLLPAHISVQASTVMAALYSILRTVLKLQAGGIDIGALIQTVDDPASPLALRASTQPVIGSTAN